MSDQRTVDNGQIMSQADHGGWRPIDSAPKDGTKILRPHRRLGVLLVRYALYQGWANEDYMTRYQEADFQPVWQPLPPAPDAWDSPRPQPVRDSSPSAL